MYFLPHLMYHIIRYKTRKPSYRKQPLVQACAKFTAK